MDLIELIVRTSNAVVDAEEEGLENYAATLNEILNILVEIEGRATPNASEVPATNVDLTSITHNHEMN